jgi:hypothetical protein
MGWVDEVLFPAGTRDFSLLHSSEPTRMGIGKLFPEGAKRPGREADYSPPSSAEVKNDAAILPLSHMSS